MRHTRIKVCGITRLEDAQCAEEQGVDAIGFVFCEASKRVTSAENAADISSSIAPFMQRVGLFLNAERSEVEHALELMPMLLPQFHGTESADWCDSFDRPYLKAIGVADGLNALGFLFDSHAPGELGGTGHTFDWSKLKQSAPARLILAGGLYPDNVQTAIETVNPYAVDVSSGVEQAKGIKDPAKIEAFVNAVRQADRASA